MRLLLAVLAVLIALFLLFTLPALAQVYQYTDAQGRNTYSTAPPAGLQSQSVHLPATNASRSFSGTKAALLPQATPLHLAPPPTYDIFYLTNLQSGERLRANNGSFSVTVRIHPPLLEGHYLGLILDNEPYGALSKRQTLPLTHLDRGEHQLAVQVLENDRVVQQSPIVTFTLLRAHAP